MINQSFLNLFIPSSKRSFKIILWTCTNGTMISCHLRIRKNLLRRLGERNCLVLQHVSYTTFLNFDATKYSLHTPLFLFMMPKQSYVVLTLWIGNLFSLWRNPTNCAMISVLAETMTTWVICPWYVTCKLHNFKITFKICKVERNWIIE